MKLSELAPPPATDLQCADRMLGDGEWFRCRVLHADHARRVDHMAGIQGNRPRPEQELVQPAPEAALLQGPPC
jgi:hypothetical protein